VSRPACSVIVPTYNRMDLLRRTLDSLVRQDCGVDNFEVLVVDDGSTDDTAGVIKSYQEDLDLRGFFQPDEGFRVAAARNVGIAHATADVCVFADSGVLLHSGCLTAHLRSQRSAEKVATIGYVYCFEKDDADAEAMLATLDFDDPDAVMARLRTEGRWLDGREPFYARYDDVLHDLPAPWLMYWTCNVAARTAQLRAVGGFDEQFRCWGGEDIDLAYRLHRDGARFLLNRDAAAIHYPHPKRYVNYKEGQGRNMRYMADKYRNPITDLLVAEPPIGHFHINDYVLERGVTES